MVNFELVAECDSFVGQEHGYGHGGELPFRIGLAIFAIGQNSSTASKGLEGLR